MADLVLDLAGQGQLPAQGRRAHDPVALGEHAHELRVGVHLDELEHRRAVLVGHPVVGLDLAPDPTWAKNASASPSAYRRRGSFNGWIVASSIAGQRVPQDRCRGGHTGAGPSPVSWRVVSRTSSAASTERATRARYLARSESLHASIRSGSVAGSARTSIREPDRMTALGVGDELAVPAPAPSAHRSHEGTTRVVDHDPDHGVVHGLPGPARGLDLDRPGGPQPIERGCVEAGHDRRAVRASAAGASARTPPWRAIDADRSPVAADLRSRDVEVDRQQAGGPYEQVVGEDGVDRADPPPAAPAEAAADGDPRPAPCAQLTAAPVAATGPATRISHQPHAEGRLPNGSPSRWSVRRPSRRPRSPRRRAWSTGRCARACRDTGSGAAAARSGARCRPRRTGRGGRRRGRRRARSASRRRSRRHSRWR